MQPFIAGEVQIHPTATIHPTAVLDGTIRIGANTSIGAGSVLVGHITVGDNCKLQINVSLRGYHGAPVVIGDWVNVYDNANIEGGRGIESHGDVCRVGDWSWINHGAVMHGSTIGSRVVIGMNVALNYHCRIGDGAIVMEGSACPVDTEVPADCVAMGVPAAIVQRSITDADRQRLVGLDIATYIRLHAEGNQRFHAQGQRPV